MNKKVSLGFTISLIAIAAAITFILTSTFSLKSFNTKIKDVKERAEKYVNFEEFDTIIRSNYNGTIDENALLDSIFAGYVTGLGDAYAHYYSKEEYDEQKRSDAGEFLGIGISYLVEESGYLRIAAVTEESPAEAAGILVDDVIIAVDGADILEIGIDQASSIIATGEEGSTVVLTISRAEVESSVTVERRIIEEISVEGEMLANNVGYIRIKGFNGNTAEQFNIMLYKLISEGATAFVFDVRNNYGGLLSSVEAVLNDLVPEGDIALATYNDGTEKVVVRSDSVCIDKPMVVITNSNTASAAELFASALRDFNGSQLVGVNTYGKGVMQNTFLLSNGGAVSVTVATYRTAKSSCYDGVGLAPDFVVALPDGETIDTVTHENDLQLIKAIEVVTTGK